MTHSLQLLTTQVVKLHILLSHFMLHTQLSHFILKLHTELSNFMLHTTIPFYNKVFILLRQLILLHRLIHY